MTLLDAEVYDPRPARRRHAIAIAAVVLVLAIAGLGWTFRYWPEEHVADKFFTALQAKDYELAYATWMQDPQWKRNQPKYARYTYTDFYRDWGPGGEWGLIRSHKIYGSVSPEGPGKGSGVIVEVVVNDRAEHARLWVEKSDHTLGFSPY